MARLASSCSALLPDRIQLKPRFSLFNMIVLNYGYDFIHYCQLLAVGSESESRFMSIESEAALNFVFSYDPATQQTEALKLNHKASD